MTITEIFDDNYGNIDDLINELNRFKINAIKKYPNAYNFRYEIVKEEKHYKYEPSYTVAQLILSYENNIIL